MDKILFLSYAIQSTTVLNKIYLKLDYFTPKHSDSFFSIYSMVPSYVVILIFSSVIIFRVV